MNTKAVISGGTFEIRPITNKTVEKISDAIQRIKDTNTQETEMTLTFSELEVIRRLLISDDISMELSLYNVKDGIEYRRSLKNKE